MNRRRLLCLLASLPLIPALHLLPGIAGNAHAADYPVKPIRLIVPFPPGTATDTVVRVLAPALSTQLGQQVIVVNMAGADGAIGAAEVARSAPDGYTLLMSTNGFCAVPALRKQPPYDALKDFTPISMFGRYSFFLFTNSNVPGNDLRSFLEHVRSQPGKLNYATGNPTGIVATGQTASLANLSMTHVPYKGEPAAMLDLVANRVQVMFATPTTASQYVREGKLRMLATTLPKRSPTYPDVPTMNEVLPAFSVPSWAALQGPARLPRDIAERLSREMAIALKKPEVQEQLARQQFFAEASTPAQLSAYLRDQLELYARVLRDSGVQAE